MVVCSSLIIHAFDQHTPQVISQVVAEDRPVYVLQMSRAEAEAKYGQAMYNNRHPVRLHFGVCVGVCVCVILEFLSIPLGASTQRQHRHLHAK